MGVHCDVEELQCALARIAGGCSTPSVAGIAGIAGIAGTAGTAGTADN